MQRLIAAELWALETSSRLVTRQSQPEWFGCGGRDDPHDEPIVDTLDLALDP